MAKIFINRKESLLRLICIIALVLFASIYFQVKWLPRYPDPYGYLSNAAVLANAGYDWSSVTQEIQALYAGGYSICLVLFFWLAEDFLTLTKYIFAFNLICLCVLFYTLCQISNYILYNVNSIYRTLLCFAICVSPACFYPIFTVTPELLGMTLFAKLLHCLIKIEYRKVHTDILYLAGLFLTFFLILVHSRYLIVWACYFVGTVILVFQRRIKPYVGGIGFFILSIEVYLYRCFTKFLSTNVFAISNSDIAGTPNTLETQILKFFKYILNGERLNSVIENIITHSFYLIFSTYLLLAFFIIFCVKETRQIVLKRKINVFNVFAILSFWGILLLSAYTFMNPKRWDHLLYGRHVESVLPVIILISVCELQNEMNGRKRFLKISLVTAIFCILAGSLVKYRIVSENLTRSIPRTIPSLEFAYDYLKEDSEYFVVLGMAAAIVVIMLGILMKRYGNKQIFLYLILILIIINQIRSTNNAIRREEYDNVSQREPYLLFEKLMGYENLNIYATENGSYNYLLQLIAYKKPVTVVADEEIQDIVQTETNYVIYDQSGKASVTETSALVDIESIKGNIWVGGSEYINYLQSLEYALSVE